MREDINHTKNEIDLYWRAANYLTVAQIFLQDNLTMERELRFNDLKERFSGHWGTSPGINYIYAHINLFVKKYRLNTMVVIGVGHAGAALMSNLFLDGTLKRYYKEFDFSKEGVEKFVRSCGYYGIRSEINPQMPGTIYDGGELGYSMAVAQGAVMDKADLVCFCMIGDGETESGTITASFLASRLLKDANSGIVIPIIHLNGYKMGNPSVLSFFSDEELVQYFSGIGYEPVITEACYEPMAAAFDKIGVKVSDMHKKGCRNKLPLLIVKSEKGWTMPLHDGHHMTGIDTHKIPIENIRSNDCSLRYLEDWLKSYKPESIFSVDGSLRKEVLNILPKENLCVGDCLSRIYGKYFSYVQELPKLEKFENTKGKVVSSMERADTYLCEVIHKNRNVRVMSPDELKSNQLYVLAQNCTQGYGKVLEVLNENICMGWSQGYIQTGGIPLIVTYEAFAPIMTSMLAQYEKYIYQAKLLKWRKEVGSLNIILTSLWWKNTYSHQNPEFLNALTAKQWNFIHVYFPVDGNMFLVILEKMLLTKNRINAVVITKNPVQQVLNLSEARKAVGRGIVYWNLQYDFAVYDIVVVLIGECAFAEANACRSWIDRNLGGIRVLFLSLINLRLMDRKLGDENEFFHMWNGIRESTPVVFVFHGYPSVIRQLLFDDKGNRSISILGYQDKSMMSAPIEVKLAVNDMSRYDIVFEIITLLHKNEKISRRKYKMFADSVMKSKKELIKGCYDICGEF